jgi:hypothetical protein
MKKPSSFPRPSRHRFNFLIDRDLLEGLQAIRERDGINESEQIRRAIRDWLSSREVPSQSRTPQRKTRAHPQPAEQPLRPEEKKPPKFDR